MEREIEMYMTECRLLQPQSDQSREEENRQNIRRYELPSPCLVAVPTACTVGLSGLGWRRFKWPLGAWTVMSLNTEFHVGFSSSKDIQTCAYKQKHKLCRLCSRFYLSLGGGGCKTTKALSFEGIVQLDHDTRALGL